MRRSVGLLLGTSLLLLGAFGAPSASGQETPVCDAGPFGQFPATIVGAGTIIGTPGDDVIVGSAGNDVISGLDGNDVICGEAGNDVISGGRGDDILVGDGSDVPPFVVSNGMNDDRLSGGSGNDVLAGLGGDDSLEGGSGDDRLVGRAATTTSQAVLERTRIRGPLDDDISRVAGAELGSSGGG